jgi:hypothetical protein
MALEPRPFWRRASVVLPSASWRLLPLSPALRSLLNFYNPVGPLSGKTTVALIVWLVAWYGLSRSWRMKTVNMRAINVAAFISLGIGFLLTCPPFWGLFL